ncbi:adenylate/guanylate cyclase domain-containing protein [Microvirga splendida]|uniref:Adenylate/guanylate cyclase domain-containing protein n=1 Tax=Microvirga splendida TaxID=2795727 RepID=A0ABS0Y3I0_9HYPH|nr:adenylate/guanylate cyclase domain-containing protein [Microvirga splendida]MBJ6126868.1 adenylate/guanylate cyclase domain-containing protein [Microvirga splendida]
MLILSRLVGSHVPGAWLATGASQAIPDQRRSDDLPEYLENDFDRQALVPRFLVLAILGAAALLEYGHGHREGHWIVLAIYWLTTIALALSSRFTASWAWLPWVATVTDAGLAVYVIADHLPRDAHDMLLATDAVSLFPAFLLLIQTGLRLRRDLVAAFAGIVLLGWIVSFTLLVGPEALPAPRSPSALAARQALAFISFAAAAGFVFYAVRRMRMAWSTILRAQWDQMLLSRFLPEGVATEVVTGDEAAEIAERHACLLLVDIRGFSALTQSRPSQEVISDLMAFRRFVHGAVSRHNGIVDKYLGDGVLAVFLHGTPEQQAAHAFEAACEILRPLDTWKSHAHAPAGVHVIATLHCGSVLAGVFDDGRRAEFTVLGPAMNALPRMERRSKEANLGVVVSKRFLRLLPPAAQGRIDARPVERRPGDEQLPDILSVRFMHPGIGVHRGTSG